MSSPKLKAPKELSDAAAAQSAPEDECVEPTEAEDTVLVGHSSSPPESSHTRMGLRHRVGSTRPPAASEPPDDDEPLIGCELLGRVRIERAIARGGMGQVYYGEQLQPRRPCAIKILAPRESAPGQGAELSRRFLLEASTASRIAHPNVVTIFDYGETADGGCFIAMEYLEGRALSEELRVHGPLAPERAIHVARQVARALRAAHAIGVVHRDMKPGNIFLLKRDDDDDFVKVLDFGLVKDTSPPSESKESTQIDHTHIGQILGSPRYMAPEQVNGQPVDGRTDVYSLGAVLYAMLAGRPPFERGNDLSTMMAQVSDPPEPIASAAPGVVLPVGLEAVVMKCLAKRPRDRFASMEELVRALRLSPDGVTTAGDSGQHASPPLPVLAASYRSPVRPRRNALTLVLVVGTLLGAALTVVLLLQGRPHRPSVAPPSVTALPQAPQVAAAPPPVPKPTATLHVETDPPGVKVKEEEDVVCEATPCDIAYVGEKADPTYEHLLTLLKANYRVERKLVRVGASPMMVKMTRAR